MSASQTIKRWAAPVVKPRLRRLRFRIAELTDRTDVHDGPSDGGLALPPVALRRLNGPGDFEAMGAAIVADLRRTVGVDTGDRVLDVGCGCGRVARHLVDVVGPTGSYDGFDVVPEAVSWCRRHITPTHPNFRFEHVDVHSDHYHRGGGQSAEEFRFPHDDEQFDVVLVTSIFTHLRRDATENYLREATRVLRPGGRLFATFFLLDDATREAMGSGRTEMTFEAVDGGAHVSNPRDPDAAVAHDEEAIRSFLRSCGTEPEVRPGNWRDGAAELGFQDVVTATKPSGQPTS